MMVRLTGFQRLSPDLPATNAGRDARRDHRGVQRRRRRRRFDRRRAAARHRAGLRARRNDPARRRQDPGHHPPDQRAVRRDVVVRQLQLRRRRSLRACRATSPSRPAIWFAAACSALRPIRSRCPTRCSRTIMQYCQNYWRSVRTSPARLLDSARRVVAAAPISPGAGRRSRLPRPAPQLMRHASRPAARGTSATQADSRPPTRRSRSTRPTAKRSRAKRCLCRSETISSGQESCCSSEQSRRGPSLAAASIVMYGMMLQSVGRYADAVAQFRPRRPTCWRSTPDSQFALADSLTVVGKPRRGEDSTSTPHIDLNADSDLAKRRDRRQRSDGNRRLCRGNEGRCANPKLPMSAEHERPLCSRHFGNGFRESGSENASCESPVRIAAMTRRPNVCRDSGSARRNA